MRVKTVNAPVNDGQFSSTPVGQGDMVRGQGQGSGTGDHYPADGDEERPPGRHPRKDGWWCCPHSPKPVIGRDRSSWEALEEGGAPHSMEGAPQGKGDGGRSTGGCRRWLTTGCLPPWSCFGRCPVQFRSSCPAATLHPSLAPRGQRPRKVGKRLPQRGSTSVNETARIETARERSGQEIPDRTSGSRDLSRRRSAPGADDPPPGNGDVAAVASRTTASRRARRPARR